MKYIASLVLGLSTIAATPALATDTPVKHYEAAKIPSSAEAFTTMKETTAKINDILAHKTLDNTKMEAIHEISYTLEEAVATLIKSDNVLDKKNLSELSETVESLHLASEDHEAENTQKWGKKLEASVAALEMPAK